MNGLILSDRSTNGILQDSEESLWHLAGVGGTVGIQLTTSSLAIEGRSSPISEIHMNSSELNSVKGEKHPVDSYNVANAEIATPHCQTVDPVLSLLRSTSYFDRPIEQKCINETPGCYCCQPRRSSVVIHAPLISSHCNTICITFRKDSLIIVLRESVIKVTTKIRYLYVGSFSGAGWVSNLVIDADPVNRMFITSTFGGLCGL